MDAIVIMKYILKMEQKSITCILFSKLLWVYTDTNNEKKNF